VAPRLVLNVDAGELPGEPEALYELAHLVNIACGGHAGDEASMERVLAFCKRFGTMAGAHPSYADREGFGRRALQVSAVDVEASVRAQVQALAGAAKRTGVPVLHVKPHGALYHAANRDPALAGAVVRASRAALDGPVTIVGPAGGALEEAARSHRPALAFAREGFADRGVMPDGSLIPRGKPGDMITLPSVAAARARELASSGSVDTICVHGDTEGSVAIARAVRRELDATPR
jgi:5-oxoprolinase (ATP-hydrolysing) subunit A